MVKLKYIAHYSQDLQSQVRELIANGELGKRLADRYASGHTIRTDGALYDYVIELKNEFLRSSTSISKVCFDNKLSVIRHALGTHTTISRVQGSKLKSKREIRIASLFKDVPTELLRMISVHELAHLRERSHDKAFYRLCCHMEPDYHQLEFDLRLYLTWQELPKEDEAHTLWPAP